MLVRVSTTDTASPKRDHLMATAWRLFYRDGFRAVGIDTLLAEAGVAKMTLYNHFSSKEDLIVALLEKHDRAVCEGLVAAVEAAGRVPLRRLTAVFDWLEAWFESEDFKGCIFIRGLSEYPEPNHPIHQAAWRHKMAFRKILARVCTDTGTRNPARLAESLALMIDGAIVAAHATGSSAPAVSAKAATLQLLRSDKRDGQNHHR